MAVMCFSNPSLVSRRVRAYFAAVNRQSQTPILFDAAEHGGFNLDAPLDPWIDLGWIKGFRRKSASKSAVLSAGVPATPLAQVRSALEARVDFQFLSWTKLSMALATGSQHMNLLKAMNGAALAADGGKATPAVSIQNGSTAALIVLSASDAATFGAGMWIAVDSDYAGETGFVGSPVSGAYLRQPGSDVDYIRRVTFNVGLVAKVSANALSLAKPLLGGVPPPGAKVQAISGFVDREGGTFYQEWSALFVQEGSQGERVFFHYPRLQSVAEATEELEPLDDKRKDGLQKVSLRGQFTAMPVIDPLDGEQVLCYRSLIPAPNALI